MGEIWKDIPEYEGVYKISTEGKILSLTRTYIRESGVPLNLKQKERRCRLDEKGYLRVQLWKNNKPKNHRLHQLLGITFIPNPYNYDTINHIDGDKTNNSLSNLEWCSSDHNTKEAIRIGLIKTRPIAKKKHNIILGVYTSITEAANKEGLERSSIFRCLSGKYKFYKGYTWEYVE
jgi:hypothetical protein